MTTWNGFRIEGGCDREPADWNTRGGLIPCIDRIIYEDPEYVFDCLAEPLGLGEEGEGGMHARDDAAEVHRIAQWLVPEHAGEPCPRWVEDWLLRHWEDEIQEALMEEAARP